MPKLSNIKNEVLARSYYAAVHTDSPHMRTKDFKEFSQFDVGMIFFESATESLKSEGLLERALIPIGNGKQIYEWTINTKGIELVDRDTSLEGEISIFLSSLFHSDGLLDFADENTYAERLAKAKSELESALGGNSTTSPDEWAPIAVDESTPGYQEFVEDFQGIITEVSTSNGYSDKFPEEKDVVVSALNHALEELKTSTTVSIRWIVFSIEEPLLKAKSRFGKATTAFAIDKFLDHLWSFVKKLWETNA